MNYKVIIFSKFDKELSLIWKALEKECDHYVFQSYDWLANWYKTIGISNYNILPKIIVVSKNSIPIALLPLGIRKSLGARVLEFLGGDQSDYNAPLILPKYSTLRKSKNIWEIIKDQLPVHDIQSFSNLPSKINQSDNTIIHLWKCRYVYDSHYCSLPKTWKSYCDNISSKILNDSKRQFRRLEKKGNLEFLIASNNDEYNFFISSMFKQKRKRYQKTGAIDILSVEATRLFYKEFYKFLNFKKLIHLSVLRLNNEIIATHWGITYKKRFYFLLPTYADGEWSKYSAGRLLQQKLIEWAINNNFEIFDFTIGNEAYKKSWCNHSMEIFSSERLVSIFGIIFIMNSYISRYLKSNRTSRKLLMKINKFIMKYR